MTTIPINFWDQFDERIQLIIDKTVEQIDKRFEQIDKRFEQIDKRFEQIDKRFEKLENKLDNVIKWTQRQDLSIEIELQKALYAHFIDKFLGFYTINPEALPKRIKGQNGKEITEFDGVLVLSSSSEVARLYGSGKHEKPSPEQVFNNNVKAYIVIVEAKQHITRDKVIRKLKQREQIEALLQAAHKEGPHILPKHLQSLGFHYLQPVVGLYIGGQIIDPNAKETILHDIETRRNLSSNIFSGWLELNGARFSVHDQHNQYGTITFGGKNRTKITKTIL